LVEVVSTIDPFSKRARVAASGARLVTSICSTWSARSCIAGGNWRMLASRFAWPCTCAADVSAAGDSGAVTCTSNVPPFAVTVAG
jgi:hypothetical protein